MNTQRQSLFATSTCILGLLLTSQLTRADGSVEVTLFPAPQLTRGDRVEFIARVTVLPASNAPMTVTPSAEGTAIEVVRGRLLRVDAVDPHSNVLEFRIPIIARSAGTSVLRVRVTSYACRGENCYAVRGETSMTLQVH